MNKWTEKILITVAKAAATVAIVLLLWWLFAEIAQNDLILPTPWEVVKQTVLLLGKGETYLALVFTLVRALVAFVLSGVVALALALLVGVFPKTQPFVDGIVTFFRALPTVAIILLAMVAFKSAIVPVLVAFLVAFPVIYSAFRQAITSDTQLLRLSKVYDILPAKRVGYILLPQIGKVVLPQCKDTLPLAIKVIIAGEVLALPRLGLGKEMYVAKVNLLTAQVLALTLLVLVVCFVLSGIFSLCERKVTK